MHCIEQDSLSRRRSVYGLGHAASVSDSCLVDTVESCVMHCPTPFNVQSARVAILFKEHHKEFWQMVEKEVLQLTSGDKRAAAKEKIAAFANAYGTILFFEDKEALKNLKKKFPLYAKNMRLWTQQANGMLQYMIWQALAENEIGASLQHYNELVTDKLYAWLDLPKHWELVAQMVFGSIEKEPARKTFLPLEERIKIFD